MPGAWPENVVHTESRCPLSLEEAAYVAKRDLPGGPSAVLSEAPAVFARDFAGGQMARDMTLFVDIDGSAYHIYASEANGNNAHLEVERRLPEADGKI